MTHGETPSTAGASDATSKVTPETTGWWRTLQADRDAAPLTHERRDHVRLPDVPGPVLVDAMT